MKTILIIGAMEEEIVPFLSLGDFTKHESRPYTYHDGRYGDYHLIITVSKVGKIAMSSCAQHFITLLRYADDFKDYELSLIINMGVAGAISPKLKQGDIVIADKLCSHDMDVSGLGYEPGLNPDYPTVYFKTPENIILDIQDTYKKLDTDYSLQTGIIASGDQFVSSKEQKERISSLFDAYACEMEGAALAQTAYDNDIPFLVIRAISDLADGEAPLSYGDFKEQAIVHLTELVQAFLKK